MGLDDTSPEEVPTRFKLLLVGRKTRKQVVHPVPSRRLRKEMRPSYFWMIPLLIQSPRPVPLVDLVLKNGSKSFLESCGLTPAPVSTMETVIPRRPSVQSCASRTVIPSFPPSGIA